MSSRTVTVTLWSPTSTIPVAILTIAAVDESRVKFVNGGVLVTGNEGDDQFLMGTISVAYSMF